MNAVRQRRQGTGSVPIEQVFQLLEQQLWPSKLGPGFFLLQNRAIFVSDASQRVEVPWMDGLTEHARIEEAESVGEDGSLSAEDAWLIAQHIEVSDEDIDDSWLPSEWLEELIEETFEQREAVAARLVAEASSESAAPERVALIRRIMLMKVKDRMKLGMKGDREARNILIRDPNRLVASAVVNNPRITEQEVEMVAAMRSLPEDLLRQIAMLFAADDRRQSIYIRRFVVIEPEPRLRLQNAAHGFVDSRHRNPS